MDVFRTKAFERSVRALGATDEELQALEAAIAADPDAGDVIRGLKGARKIRFAMAGKGKGKSGGGRAIYVVVRVREAVYLLLAYAKSAQAEISNAQRKAIKAFIEGLP